MSLKSETWFLFDTRSKCMCTFRRLVAC